MSWSVSTPAPVAKHLIDEIIDSLTVDAAVCGPAGLDQLHTAKAAAKAIAVNIPGPYIVVTLAGHANGVGWQAKDGWANDCISVSVSQMNDKDIRQTPIDGRPR